MYVAAVSDENHFVVFVSSGVLCCEYMHTSDTMQLGKTSSKDNTFLLIMAGTPRMLASCCLALALGTQEPAGFPQGRA